MKKKKNTNISLNKYQVLPKCMPLTKLLNHSFRNTELVCMSKRTF
jgi:hypothetical protein